MFKSRRSTMIGMLMVLALVAGVSGLAIALFDGLSGEAEALTKTPGALECHYHTLEGVHCGENLED